MLCWESNLTQRDKRCGISKPYAVSCSGTSIIRTIKLRAANSMSPRARKSFGCVTGRSGGDLGAMVAPNSIQFYWRYWTQRSGKSKKCLILLALPRDFEPFAVRGRHQLHRSPLAMAN